MDNSESNTDIQLFNFAEGDTILKGLLFALIFLFIFIGYMALFVKNYINYYYSVYIIAFIIFTILFDSYNVKKFGFITISMIIGFCYCIYLNFHLSKKNY